MPSEDYSRSRPLATIEHLGRRFHIVRRKFDGKPWRQYLILVYGGVAMTSDFPRGDDISDPAQVAAFYTAELARLFPDRPGERERLDDQIKLVLASHDDLECARKALTRMEAKE